MRRGARLRALSRSLSGCGQWPRASRLPLLRRFDVDALVFASTCLPYNALLRIQIVATEEVIAHGTNFALHRNVGNPLFGRREQRTTQCRTRFVRGSVLKKEGRCILSKKKSDFYCCSSVEPSQVGRIAEKTYRCNAGCANPFPHHDRRKKAKRSYNTGMLVTPTTVCLKKMKYTVEKRKNDCKHKKATHDMKLFRSRLKKKSS